MEESLNTDEEIPCPCALENPEPPVTIRRQELMESMRCPVCTELVTPQIYSCQNGHHLCNICWEQITLCPQCKAPKGARNIFAEQFIESHVNFCKNNSNGCRANFWKEDTAHQLQNHEETCKYRSLNCWVPNCTSRLIGPENLAFHWETQHEIKEMDTDEESLVITVNPDREYQYKAVHLKRDGNSFLGIVEVVVKNKNQFSCLGYVYGYTRQDSYKYTITTKYQEDTGTRTETWTGGVHQENVIPGDISVQEKFYHIAPIMPDSDSIPTPFDIHIKVSVWAAPATRSRQSSMHNE